MSSEEKKIRPAPMKRYKRQEPKLAIKSSLPNVKSTLALVILIWESLDYPSEVIYSKQSGSGIILADDVEVAIKKSVVDICSNDNIDLEILIEKINNNQLFKSQLEALIVAFELIWKIAVVRFVDDDRTTLERSGGRRFPKKFLYTSNVDIIHCLISEDKRNYYKVILSWMGMKIQTDETAAKNLSKLLSLLSENAVFKMLDGDTPVIFNQNSLYLKILETQSEVDINGDSEPKGTLRILKNLLFDDMNPYLKYSSGSVSLNSDVKDLQNYQRRVENFLRLSEMKEFEFEDTVRMDSEVDIPEISESSRVSVGVNVILYGVPGSGKSWTIEHEYCRKNSKVERLVFHPDYTYAEFIGQILPDVDDGDVTYKFSPGPFTSILRDAYQNPTDEYILIIEEINRGNAPAIFGEVFQLLDRMIEPKTINGVIYPAGTSEYEISNRNMAVEIYGNGNHKIRIPSNLSIIGTMNTSDQNVFTLDTAFQRRWNMRLIENSFKNVRPSLASAEILDTGVTWRHFCESVNNFILDNKNKLASAEDKRMGVYFVHENDLQYRNLDLQKYEELLLAERDSKITEEEKIALSQMREDFKQNRKFAEKVIKYLWDDAFKFNSQDLFDSSFSSLESVIRRFVFSDGRERFSIFRQSVQDIFFK